MSGSFEMPMMVFNLILLCALAAIPIVVLIVSARPGWGDASAYRTSMRARLPFGNDAVHRSVRARLRRITRVNMWGLLGAIVVLGVLFLATPLASTPYALWILTLLILVVALAGGTLVGQLRERLFAPEPEAPRIARLTDLRTRDYLGAWRTVTPVVLLIAATAGTLVLGILTVSGRVPLEMLLLTAGALVLAIAAAIGTRLLERHVLAQPQPASDTLELAWDDLFRVDALSSMRMSAAMTAWLPLGMVGAMLVSLVIDGGISLFTSGPPFRSSPDLTELMTLFPWWGIPVLQIVYTLGNGRLPAALYPAFLRTPVGAPA